MFSQARAVQGQKALIDPNVDGGGGWGCSVAKCDFHGAQPYNNYACPTVYYSQSVSRSFNHSTPTLSLLPKSNQKFHHPCKFVERVYIYFLSLPLQPTENGWL